MIALLSDLNVRNLYAAASPFEALRSTGFARAYVDVTDGVDDVFGVIKVGTFGWVVVAFTDDVVDDSTVVNRWEKNGDRLGDLLHSLLRPLTTTYPSPSDALLALADEPMFEFPYNQGNWSVGVVALAAVLDQIHTHDPVEHDGLITLMALRSPAALAAIDRWRRWAANQPAENFHSADVLLNTVAMETWPTLVPDDDVIDLTMVHHFMCMVPHEEWTRPRVQGYLRSEARNSQSPFARTLGSQIRAVAVEEAIRDGFAFYDFFLSPQNRSYWGSWSAREVARLERAYGAEPALLGT